MVEAYHNFLKREERRGQGRCPLKLRDALRRAIICGANMTACHIRLTGIAVRKVTFALCTTRLKIIFGPHNQDGRTPQKLSPFDQKSSKIKFGQRLGGVDVQVDSHLIKCVNKSSGAIG